MSPHVAAHEQAHRAQWAAREQVPRGDRRALERDAERGARALRAGNDYQPTVAPSPGMALHYSPYDWMPDPAVVTAREQATDDELMLVAGRGADARLELSNNTDLDGVTTVQFRNVTRGSGRRGSITSTTEITAVNDPGDPTTTISVPSLNPFEEIASAEVPAYPVSLRYARTIEYTDADGRTCVVEIAGGVHFTHARWQQELEGRTPNFESLQQLVGDAGSLAVELRGQGPIEDFAYRGDLLTSGHSIATLTDSAARMFGFDGGLLHMIASAPAEFIRPERAAGEQFDALNKFLFDMDQHELARRAALEAERARRAAEAEADRSWLDDVSDWLGDNISGPLGDLWGELPAPVRGVLSAVGKAAVAIGVVFAAAAVIVALAPVELTVTGVALAIGGIALGVSFVRSLMSRNEESDATGEGGLGSIIAVSAADAIGIGGIYEGVTNESMLSGVPLGLSEEERWERGTLGTIQTIGTVFGARAALKRTPFYGRTTTVGDPTLAPGTGGTDRFGNVRYSTQGSAVDQALVRAHEGVHSTMSPRFALFRNLRAGVRMGGYQRSALLRYAEEALAETYAQWRVNGIRGVPEGLRFPIANGYVTLSRVVTEAAIGTIIYAGILYGVYVIADDYFDDADAATVSPP